MLLLSAEQILNESVATAADEIGFEVGGHSQTLKEKRDGKR
jgi:hypothetical protein